MESLPRDGYELTSWEILPGVTLSAPGCISDRAPGLDKATGRGGGFGDNRRLGPREVGALFGNREGARHERAAWIGGLERDFHVCVVVEFGRQDDDVGEFLTERGEATRVGMGAHPSPRRPRTPNRGPTLT